MQHTFHRDRVTWLLYLSIALYGYFLNVLGPITPFLKEELQLSYTVSSFHFTAFAIGILLVGAGGHLVIERLGQQRSLWLGLFGMSLSALLLIVGKIPLITIGASFLMGCIGSLVLAIVPSALSHRHGDSKAVALSEANSFSSLIAAFAPLMVGWFAGAAGGWRLALAIMACMPIFMFMALRKDSSTTQDLSEPVHTPEHKSLPKVYWIYWTAIVLGVSVEFCMIFWSANYMEQGLGLAKASAARAVSLFLAGMILGRFLGSRLVQRYPTRRVVMVSILTAGFGFLCFWMAENIWIGLIGLFVTGLGVANFYPLTLSLAIGAANGDTTQAGARATLASGTAILILPMALGSLADSTNIHQAYGVVVLLLIGILLIQLVAQRLSQAQGVLTE